MHTDYAWKKMPYFTIVRVAIPSLETPPHTHTQSSHWNLSVFNILSSSRIPLSLTRLLHHFSYDPLHIFASPATPRAVLLSPHFQNRSWQMSRLKYLGCAILSYSYWKQQPRICHSKDSELFPSPTWTKKQIHNCFLNGFSVKCCQKRTKTASNKLRTVLKT